MVWLLPTPLWEKDGMQFNRSDVDYTIALLNVRRTGTIGFNAVLCPDDNGSSFVKMRIKQLFYLCLVYIKFSYLN